MLGLWTSLCCMGVNSWADDSGRYPVPAIVYPLAQGASPFSALGFVRFTSNGTATDTLRYPDSGIETKSWMTQGKPIPIPMQPADRMAISPQRRRGRRTPVAVPNCHHPQRTRHAARVHRPDRDATHPGCGPPEALDATIRRIPGLGAIARLDDLPTVYSPWDDLRIDGLGNIWVMASGPRGARDHWDVFSAEGVLLGAVSAPFDEISGRTGARIVSMSSSRTRRRGCRVSRCGASTVAHQALPNQRKPFARRALSNLGL